MKQHKLSLVVLGALAIALVFAHADEARAQAGDLDILSRSVPPIVMLQVDSSGSMKNIILPQKYLTDRGASNPTVWFNRVTNNGATPAGCSGAACYSTTSPASRVDTTYYYSGSTSTESFQPTCQIFPNSTTVTRSQSICFPGTTGCTNDDQDDSDPQSGATMRCWNMPGGCAYVPTGLTCSTASRSRKKTSTTSVSQPYTIITMPDVSFTSTTDFPINYLWWMLQEIYLGRVPVPYINQDRNGAAKQAVAAVVNAINIDGEAPRVKFGLARYHEDTGDDNGGYVLVPPDLNNKATLLAALNNIPASGSTPLSETLVDVARYLAGADKLGPYPQYNRDLNGNTVAASSAPQSPITSSCEKLFVIAVTDGIPTNDSNNHYGTNYNTVFGSYNDGDGQLLDDVAAKLWAADLRSTVSGQQNVSTYTVGFTLNVPMLADAAARGHGQYFNSNNADELADSLVGAIQDIITRNTTLSSATVPASRTAFDNGFYTAYFLPSGRKSVWPGHLEAYTMDASLNVLDANGNPAIDPATDLFLEPRHPFWDVGARLVAGYNSRTLYTNKGGVRVPLTAANLVDPNSSPTATNLVPADIGLTDPNAKNLYPQPATHVSINDPNDPNSLVVLAKSVIEFARGADAFDEDNDGNLTEVRDFVFGDVFHSSPLAIGSPPNSMRFETNYGPASNSSSFMGRYLFRKRVLYVGANDGFLHAIDAGTFTDPNPAVAGDEYYTPGTGDELFGYVPSMVLPKLKSLPRDDIAKVYYVDGPPTAADAWVDYNGNGTKEGDDWTTVMITPLREGGEGMLALDITNPAATSGNHGPYPRLMWEFTDAGLGQTWSRPIITRVKLKGAFGTGDKCGADDGDGDCVETWVAIFGAGYRNESNPNMGVYISDPNNATAKKGRGIYMVRISDGSILAQVKQSPVTTDPLNKMAYAITAEPAVLDLNNDGFADLVYIGDTGGQMWKWDISAVATLTSGKVPNTVWPAGLFFQAPVATIAAGAKHYHSIFQGAAAAYLKGILSLSFGSGERADLGYVGDPVTPADPNDIVGLYDDNNRFWVVLDRAVPAFGTGAFPSTLPIYEAATSGHQNLTDITYTASDTDPNDAGYFFRVPDGQKFITDNIVFSGQVFSLTYMPDAANAGSGGSCALGGTTIQWAWTLSSGVGVLDNPTDPTTTVRNATLSNGAPTNPRITVAKGPDGKPRVKVTVQTSTGQQPDPPHPPKAPEPVSPIFWRQSF